MIRRVSHYSVYVLDQDSAKTFYADKLGFEVRTDARIGEFRWLTVGPRTQPDLEVALMALKPTPMMDADAVAQLRGLVERGVLGGGVLESSDVRQDYEELKGRGVEFMAPPAERPYGVEAVLRDDSGNFWTLTQRR